MCPSFSAALKLIYPTLSTLLQETSPTLQVRAPSPILPCFPIEALVKLDMQYSSSTNNADNAYTRLVQLLIITDIVNRLQASTHVFHLTLANASSRTLQSLHRRIPKQSNSLVRFLITNFQMKNSNFMSSLKSSNRSLLTSFLTIIKQKPSFICACLCAMTENDILTFFLPFVRSF